MIAQIEDIRQVPDNNIVVYTGAQFIAFSKDLAKRIAKEKIEVKPIPLYDAAEHFGVTENTLRVWSKAKKNGFPIHNMGDGKGKAVVFWHEITDAVLNHKFQKSV